MGVSKMKRPSREEAALNVGIAKYGLSKWSKIGVVEFSRVLGKRSNVDLKGLMEEELEHLEIEMEEIKLASGKFDDRKFIGIGGFGKACGGKLSRFNERNMVAFVGI
ncbi:hypothetical protein Tco_0532873 [Tanacetum coccineum]